jgi:polyphosphate kinase 2
VKKKAYEARLEPLQLELNNLARWLKHTGRRMVVVVEGRDTAGKGGVISAITAQLNPRQVHVVALGRPSERERTQWYFQRYVAHLPAAGEMVLFDRSWYNRAGVEHVMGFCSEAEYNRFLAQAPVFEQMLVEDGMLLYKYWLAVDQQYQEERFAERAADPLKRWKLPRSTWRRGPGTTTTPARARPCSKPRTARPRPGLRLISTTSARDG